VSGTRREPNEKLNIDRVQPQQGQAHSDMGGWGRVISSFNPLGAVAEAYARTLSYRIESKRLAIEMERIREQAKIANNLIDKSFRLKMEELEQRRLAINRYFDTVQGQLNALHIERMQILKMLDQSMQQTLAPGLSMEERRLYKEMTVELTASLPAIGERANQTLNAMLQALPPVQMPAGLLTD
jgi:hypothetical protein